MQKKNNHLQLLFEETRYVFILLEKYWRLLLLGEVPERSINVNPELMFFSVFV